MAKRKQKKTSDAPEAVQVAAEELRAAFSGPAVRSNKIYLSSTEGGVRISFTEQHGDAVSPQFRTAVFLSFGDAISLKDLLARHVKGFEQMIKAAELEAKKADGD